MHQKTINRCMIIVMLTVFSFLGLYISTNINETPEEVISEEELLPEETPDISNGFGEYDNAVDCYLAAMAVLRNQTDYERNLSGDIVAKAAFVSVVQKMKSNITVNKAGDVYFEEVTLSDSPYSSSTAMKAFMKKDASTIDVVTSKEIDSNYNATYDDDYTTKTLSQYKQDHGHLPLDEVYIVSNKTLKKVNSFEFDGEHYRFSIELKPSTATSGYKNRIKKSAGASKLSYKSCVLDVVIDKNGYVQQVNINEKYSVNVGIDADVTSELKLSYAYNLSA